MTGYDAFKDPYCYTGSSILRNRYGIKSYDDLEAFEVAMFTLRSMQSLPTGTFDPAHYRAVHHHLFQDVYNWAGKYRTTRIAKNDVMFCYPEHIAGQMELLFASLSVGPVMGGATREDFIAAAATFLAELNAIHPFREGNGRSQLTFLFLLGEHAGHSLDMARIRSEAMLAAMVESFHGRLGALHVELEQICL